MTWARELSEDPLALADAPAERVLEPLAAAAELLDRLEEPALVRLPGGRPLRVIGDTHGDYVSARAAVTAPGGPPESLFVALGDYVDRSTRSEPTPAALPGGSLWTLLYLLAAKAEHPREVLLLQGNHEAARRLPVPGPTFLRELRALFPRDRALEVWQRSFEVMERLPLAAVTPAGVFLAHGGIPPPSAPAPARWRRDDLALLEGLLWGDPAAAYEDRGIGFPFHAPELERFLATVGARRFLRGHDPKHSGVLLYEGRCLTLQTSDLFRRFGHGGILRADVLPTGPAGGLPELAVHELVDGTWRPYAPRIAGAHPPG